MSESWQQIEYLLRTDSLWIRTTTGRYWRLRQNGKTKLWKRKPFAYRVPVKAGFRSHAYITQDTEIGTFDSDYDIICSSHDPNTDAVRQQLRAAGVIIPLQE
jgi:hypothetical protein